MTRDYAMFCLGRYFTRVVGEHAFHSRFNTSLGKAQELVKDDAITKCCRDLGIAREIWDPEVMLKNIIGMDCKYPMHVKCM